jgi:PIN domain nuclease of toxin-antitoxin system
MSIVELRYLVEKGTISEAEFEVLVSELEKSDSPYEVAPLDAGIALDVEQISRKHNADPFDRTIGATAVTLGVPLVTCDRKLRAQPAVETIW